MNSKPILSLTILAFSLSFFSCSSNKETLSDVYNLQRRNMVRWDLKAQGIKSKGILEAMKTVPRHLFLPDQHKERAYEDVDLPISQFQSTPRPYVVAKTIELLHLKGGERVLEVGTGRGYQTALLAELAEEVYSIEIVPDIALLAEKTLNHLHYQNIHIRIGDGYAGWPEKKPFDAILVMVSAESPPQPLLDQLKMGGRLVMPIGGKDVQSVTVYRKTSKGLKKEKKMEVHLKAMEGSTTRGYW